MLVQSRKLFPSFFVSNQSCRGLLRILLFVNFNSIRQSTLLFLLKNKKEKAKKQIEIAMLSESVRSKNPLSQRSNIASMTSSEL